MLKQVILNPYMKEVPIYINNTETSQFILKNSILLFSLFFKLILVSIYRIYEQLALIFLIIFLY